MITQQVELYPTLVTSNEPHSDVPHKHAGAHSRSCARPSPELECSAECRLSAGEITPEACVPSSSPPAWGWGWGWG
jgi:hypothetical protein